MRFVVLTLGLVFPMAGCVGALSTTEPTPEVRVVPSTLRPVMWVDVADAGAPVPDAPSCGDGVVTEDEMCDVAAMPAHACPPGVVACVLCIDCVLVGRYAAPCGNGRLDDGEACDDGNHDAGDGCTDCTVD